MPLNLIVSLRVPFIVFLAFVTPLLFSDYLASADPHIASSKNIAAARVNKVQASKRLASAVSGSHRIVWASERPTKRRYSQGSVREGLQLARAEVTPFLASIVHKRIDGIRSTAGHLKGVADGSLSPEEFFYELDWWQLLLMATVHVF